MNWSRRTAMAAGLALIALTNGVALGGAAYNRMGEPRGALHLSERELTPPYAWHGNSENSGLALRVRWRSLPAQESRGRTAFYYDQGGSNPGWLDERKMVSLGFRAKGPVDARHDPRDWSYQTELPRDVFVVLELDGPAYAEALRRAQERAQAANAGDPSAPARTDAQEALDREERFNSRLFAVDAGMDRAALRARFPDRTKYAIVRGRVRPIERPPGWAPGAIETLAMDEVNVPLQMRAAFDVVPAQPRYRASGEPVARFDATLMIGQRSEPWLAAATRR